MREYHNLPLVCRLTFVSAVHHAGRVTTMQRQCASPFERNDEVLFLAASTLTNIALVAGCIELYLLLIICCDYRF